MRSRGCGSGPLRAGWVRLMLPGGSADLRGAEGYARPGELLRHILRGRGWHKMCKAPGRGARLQQPQARGEGPANQGLGPTGPRPQETARREPLPPKRRRNASWSAPRASHSRACRRQ